jgi:hypothetical protein
MFTKKELEEWLDKLFYIIVDCHICSRNIERLTRRGDDDEEKVKLHGFFQLHYFQLRFILCIQYAKLFSESNNQKVSFYKLFNRLENEKYDVELNTVLYENKKMKVSTQFGDREDIIHKIKVLKDNVQHHNQNIRKVKSLRDKIYAHTDSQNIYEGENVKIEDFIDLATLASEIYNSMTSGFFGRTTLFEITEEWNIGWVLDRLAKDFKNFMRDEQSLKSEHSSE